jgi:hypothetical protein
MIVCLFDLLHDVCCELVVIVEFGFISETRGMFLTCRILRETVICQNYWFRARMFKRGCKTTLFPGSSVSRALMDCYRLHEHISYFENISFKICHIFVPEVSLAPILARIHGT